MVFHQGLAVRQTLGLALDAAEPASRAAEVRAAFRKACESELHRVYVYIRYRVCDAVAAEDLAAQVFLQALARLDTFDLTRGDIESWILGIARNVVRDYMRTHRRWHWLSLDWLKQRPSEAPSPESAAITHELQRSLARALRTLSNRERDVLGLKFAGGLTNRTIAELTGLRESHVAVIIYRAVGKLRERIDR